MNYLKWLWQHYGGLWRFAPGAMTVTHICIVGFAISIVLMKRNPLASLAALVVVLLVAACLIPACAALDMGRRDREHIDAMLQEYNERKGY